MKQFMAWVLLAILVISIVPLAGAEPGRKQVSKSVAKEAAVDGEESEAEIPPVTNVAQNENAESAPATDVPALEPVRNRLAVAKEHRDRAKERLVEMKSKVENWREKYTEVKDSYQDAKKKYQEQRSKLAEINAKVKSCKENTEECLWHKFELKKGIKQHLLKTSEVISQSLDKLVNRVESSATLTDQQKEQALSEIYALEETVTAEKEKVEALKDGEVTNEELKNAIQNLKKVWQEVRTEQRRIVANLIGNKMDNLADKNVGLVRSMQAKIDNLVKQGADVTELESIKSRFEESTAKFSADREFWKEDKTNENLQVVKDDLTANRNILKEFVRKFAEVKQGLSENETSEELGETVEGGETV